LIDIGTDHAHLPIEMIASRQANKVIAVDNKQGPYEKALANVARAGYADRIDVRLSDGFEHVREAADAASILGMGGLAIQAILEQPFVPPLDALILGAQSEAGSLRMWLSEHGWRIEDEVFVLDKGKHYPLLRAIRGTMTLTPIEARYGPVLLARRDPALFRQIECELEHLTQAYPLATDRVKKEALNRQIQTLRSLLS
jgi:tRNA (adenine22-N1)-methyltransferase